MPKKWIIVHHSATADGRTFNTKSIREYHINVNGWRDIGYHYLLEEIDGIIEVIIGRNVTDRGAHTKELDFNASAIGVCVVGNFDQVEPGRKIMDKLVPFLRSLMVVHGISPDNVLGHREAQEKGGCPPEERKTCPGRMFDMEKLRDILRIK